MKFSAEIIKSRQNRIVVDTIKLSDKKARENVRQFRFDGIKLFGEAVEKGVCFVRILICESKRGALMPLLERQSERLENTCVSVLADDVFAKVSEEHSPEGIICVAEYPKNLFWKNNLENFQKVATDKTKRIMLLESVRDPGNMGTIIRSAAAFGVDTLAISSDCADICNSKTVRGAMGALFKMNVFWFDDVCDAVELLKKSGRKIYAAALDKNAVRLDGTDFAPWDSAVIGNEGHGISDKTINACTQSLYIPMEEGSESLNAAVAASVIMWSMYRK